MEVLHRLGCSVMQGFLFSRPQPADEIEAWLQQTVLPRKAPWIGAASSIDAEPLFLLALANAKAHFQQPDAQLVLQEFEVHLQNVVARSHGAKRYIPGRRSVPAYVEPRTTVPFA